MKLIAFLIFLLFLTPAFPGFSSGEEELDTRVGQWRTHLPYREGFRVAQLNSRIYCATRNGLFYYDKSENSRGIVDPVIGLSSTRFSALESNKSQNQLLIGYTDGSIDIIQNNEILNIQDFKRFPRPGRKTINDFFVYDNVVYIGTAMGILVYDLEEKEFIVDIMNIDPDINVHDVVNINVFGQYIYAATTEGLYRADINAPNLRDPAFWEKYSSRVFSELQLYHDRMYAAADSVLLFKEGSEWDSLDIEFPGSINGLGVSQNTFLIAHNDGLWQINSEGTREHVDLDDPTHAIITQSGDIYYSLGFFGMLRHNIDGSTSFLAPNSPRRLAYFKFISSEDGIWGVGGAVDGGYGNEYNNGYLSNFNNGNWENYGITAHEVIPDTNAFQDPITIAEHPEKPLIYVGSFVHGLLEFNKEDEEPVRYFNNTNSAIQGWTGRGGSGFISGLAFDSRGNLWISNFQAEEPLVVFTADGEWYSYNLPQSELGEITIDNHDQLWIELPRARTSGLMVVDASEEPRPNQVLRSRQLLEGEGNGNLPDNRVRDITKDADGNIWLGTNDGVAVFFSPGNIFSDRPSEAQRIFLEGEEFDGVLLRQEVVSNIETDGGNRKWIASRSGIWVTSPNGRRIIKHFDEDNSPLLSNDVIDLAFEGNQGVMLFSTDLGMISLRTTSTRGHEQHTDVYAFPNPVREYYDGPISIRGLVRNAEVRITDTSGRLVYRTRAEGGQAVWEGTNMEGREVKSGVYLVLSSDENGEETYATKILLIR